MKIRPKERGNAVLEFTLVGIPLIFVLISIFEISRGMWVYQTLASGVKAASRYAIVHGYNCDFAPNACPSTVQNVATVLNNNAAGLLPGEVMVTMVTSTGGGTQVSAATSLQTLLADVRRFPQQPGNQPDAIVTVTATYPFRSALAFFWTGSKGFTFGSIQFAASSAEAIQF
jgi:Flp pilus assembly protein TadG